MGDEWNVKVGARKVAASVLVIGALVLGTTSAFAGDTPPMTVSPTTVTYDEEFTISGSGCFTQVAVGVSEVPGSQGGVTPDQAGNWSTTRSVSAEQGVSPGTLTVFAGCIEPEFDYVDVEITLTGSEPTTPTTEDPASSTTEATTAVDATTAPRFTG